MSGAHVAPTRPERPRGRRPRSPSVSAHGGPRGLFLPRPAPADLLTRASPPCAGPTCLGPRPLHSPTNQPPGPYVPGRPYGDAAVAVAGRDVRKRRQGGTPRRRGVSSSAPRGGATQRSANGIAGGGARPSSLRAGPASRSCLATPSWAPGPRGPGAGSSSGSGRVP